MLLPETAEDQTYGGITMRALGNSKYTFIDNGVNDSYFIYNYSVVPYPLEVKNIYGFFMHTDLKKSLDSWDVLAALRKDSSHILSVQFLFNNKVQDYHSNGSYNNDFSDLEGQISNKTRILVTADMLNHTIQPFMTSKFVTIAQVDWSSTLGTLYGGYIDLVNGELVQEWEKVYLNDPDKWVPHATRAYRYDVEFDREKNGSNKDGLMSNIACNDPTLQYYCRWTLISTGLFAIRWSADYSSPPSLE